MALFRNMISAPQRNRQHRPTVLCHQHTSAKTNRIPPDRRSVKKQARSTTIRFVEACQVYIGSPQSAEPYKTRPRLLSHSVTMPSRPRISSSSEADTLDQSGYSTGKVVGVGAYAKVKKATHIASGKMRAIKIVAKKKAPDGYMTKFIPREVKAMMELDHPHIIKLHETIEDSDRFFFVTELAEGGDLLDSINGSGPLTDSEAKRLFRQLVEAVAYCHSRGVIHRDLKCENILLSKEKNIKVADFGFARNLSDMSKLLSTHCGSYAYAAPEILANRPYSGPETDVWSVGIILYAMVAGRLPFNDSEGIGNLLREIERGIHIPHRMSAYCSSLIRQILMKKPAARLTASQILEHPWLSNSKKERVVVPLEPTQVTLPIIEGETSIGTKRNREVSPTKGKKKQEPTKPLNGLCTTANTTPANQPDSKKVNATWNRPRLMLRGRTTRKPKQNRPEAPQNGFHKMGPLNPPSSETYHSKTASTLNRQPERKSDRKSEKGPTAELPKIRPKTIKLS